MKHLFTTYFLFLVISISLMSCDQESKKAIDISKDNRLVFIGDNLCSRMINYGHFETSLHLQYPSHQLFIRNMCDGGNTPGFRPHSARENPWAFPGAEKFQTEYAHNSKSIGEFPSPDEWLTSLNTDIIIAFFGHSSSFNGPEGIEDFKNELEGFIVHTRSQHYNGATAPQLALVSPIAHENNSANPNRPSNVEANKNLKLYTQIIEDLAIKHNLPFSNAFELSLGLYKSNSELTIDGSQFSTKGYELITPFIISDIFNSNNKNAENRDLIQNAVNEKNWMWHNDYKIPNGVHVYGRRYEPFGPDNYPFEIEKTRQLTAIRDTSIWQANKGVKMDLIQADKRTKTLPSVTTNYNLKENGDKENYLYGKNALNSIHTAPGYKIELFASEKEFPDLANPVQLSFDNTGRLWVAVMPSYPHYKPGDTKPNDKIIILEDTNDDGKADKQTIFLEGLHLPIGFEFAPEGVYVSQGTNLKLYSDTDGDDHADTEQIIFSGFDDHDTHHAISAFCADPSGAIYMAEGVFLHTNVETSYGTVRGTHGGFYRFEPVRRHLQRIAQLSIPNPWGIAFDQWGQVIYAQTSGPSVNWMLPGTVKPFYTDATPTTANLIEKKHQVRPTSGLEFIYSSHFPASDQGDFLINNTIGFLGMKQHSLIDDGTGYKSNFKQDLFWSDDKNFRPVDMEFAPDGSLYVLDWHNVLIGHMQHNARDPLRDHVHGRIYRVTYPSRPLVQPASVVNASIPVLLENLKLPEYRSRYRSRRELRGRDKNKVQTAIHDWINKLDVKSEHYERLKLEALWVTWGLNNVDIELLQELLQADDFKVRAAAVQVLSHCGHQVKDHVNLLKTTASDKHGRVRLETIVAASRVSMNDGLNILDIIKDKPLDDWMIGAYNTARAHLQKKKLKGDSAEEIKSHLVGGDLDLYKKGKEIFERDGYCGTCHQSDGMGLKASGFPPLAGSKWVIQNDETVD